MAFVSPEILKFIYCVRERKNWEQAVVDYIKARHGDEAFDIDGIINTMILSEMQPDRVKTEVVFTVDTICKISGKSLSSLKRSCSLLKLPEAIDDGGPAGEAPII